MSRHMMVLDGETGDHRIGMQFISASERSKADYNISFIDIPDNLFLPGPRTMKRLARTYLGENCGYDELGARTEFSVHSLGFSIRPNTSAEQRGAFLGAVAQKVKVL